MITLGAPVVPAFEPDASPESSTPWLFSLDVTAGKAALEGGPLEPPLPIVNPCFLRLDGDGLTISLGGGGNWSRGTRGEDRLLPCARRALLLVAAEEARVLRGR